MPSQFNTLVQGLNIEDITPQEILAAGEPIFLDVKATSDINSINTLIQSWTRIHAPTFGQPISNSGKKFSRTDTGSIVTASGNEVRMVIAVTYTNASGAPISLDLELDDIVIQSGAIIGPAETVVATIPNNLFVDRQLSGLVVTILTGDGPSLTTTALSILVVQ
tara:strand:- start:124 stop:615 length:492 start_codon:yes stop_codon:yes gene_type:complete